MGFDLQITVYNKKFNIKKYEDLNDKFYEIENHTDYKNFYESNNYFVYNLLKECNIIDFKINQEFGFTFSIIDKNKLHEIINYFDEYVNKNHKHWFNITDELVALKYVRVAIEKIMLEVNLNEYDIIISGDW